MGKTTLAAASLLLIVAVLTASPGPASAEPLFLINTSTQWNEALWTGEARPVQSSEWGDYMAQWQSFLMEGEPYPSNLFIPPELPRGELYVSEGGGGGGGGYPEDAGLVMVWQSDFPGEYSSAWKFDYMIDPDLSAAVINVTVTAPQFDFQGNQINAVSFGIQDINGAVRAWQWGVGQLWDPIQWNVPTTIQIRCYQTGVGAATPLASGYMSNPFFQIAQSQFFIVAENATWVGGAQPVPPPPGQLPGMWNYWHNLSVTPAIVAKPVGQLKWSQEPFILEDSDPPRFLGWDELSMYPEGPIAADDWECTSNQPVTDIHWWGSFIGWDQPIPPQLPKAFHIGIWKDVPAGDLEPFSHPGVLVHEIRCENFEWNFAGFDIDPRGLFPYEACFQFNQKLNPEEWFYQEPGNEGRNIYWLSIAAIYDGPSLFPWGWKTRPHFFNDDAVRMFFAEPWPPVVGSEWRQGEPVEFQGVSWDLAFQLTTLEEEPPPNSKWVQWPDRTSQGIDIKVDGERWIADDFECTQPGLLTDVHLWGSWKFDEVGRIEILHLSVHSDDPVGPGGSDPDNQWSKPDDLLWQIDLSPEQFIMTQETEVDPGEWWWDPVTGELLQNGDRTIWRVDIDIDPSQAFRQEGGPDKPIIYWLDVQAKTSSGEFGWKTRFWPEHYNDDAVFDMGSELPRIWKELRYPWPHPYADAINNSIDMAFVLTFQPVEEPMRDLGDAPDSSNTFATPMTAYPAGGPSGVTASFPTVFAAGSPPFGPLHLNPMGAAFLGNLVTLENEADTGPDQDGTNNIIPFSDAPDLDLGDDGVAVPLTLPYCRPTTFNYTVTFTNPVAGQAMYVNVWLDWSRDGDWNDIMQCPAGQAPEWAVQDQQIVAAGPGVYTFTTPPFLPWHRPDTLADPIWMRITLSEQPWGLVGDQQSGGSGPASGYEFGETEDFYFTPVIPEPDWDWGDAPDPSFPTLSASNGARHRINPNLYLGAFIDAEANGQPGPGADRDDLNPPAGVDDEDGITFLWPVVPGLYTQIKATASAAGYLDAWIDYNRNGSWAEPNEHVTSARPVAAGDNVFQIWVPHTAKPGRSYARFRFVSSLQSLSYDGPADDGEVEDYVLEIQKRAKLNLEFSLDIGSDAELSDPAPTGNERFDPGDVYWWKGPPLRIGGEDGFKDDKAIFGQDPSPDPPDPALPPSSRVPVGSGTPESYPAYFDLDAHDQIDLPLNEMLPPGLDPLPSPMPRLLSNCIHEARWLMVSFDDDQAPGWPAFDVPVTRPSPMGMTYGTTSGRDEIIGVATAVQLPPVPVRFVYPIANEVRVHQDLAPDPNSGEERDDDVDSLDVVWRAEACPVWLFSADHEATNGLNPGHIYRVTPVGPAITIHAQRHLGLPPMTDIDAFEVAWLIAPQQPVEVLGVLFSVDDDDPLTPNVDESGGLDPRMIYYSYLMGTSFPFLQTPLRDDVDALTLSPHPFGDTIGGAKQLAIGDKVALADKVVTADLTSRPDFDLFYMEEMDRAAGIGVVPPAAPGFMLNQDDIVYVIGTTALNQGTEVIILADEIYQGSPTVPIVPVAMMNRTTGGGDFGAQPAVMNNALQDPRVLANGLSSIGTLLRTWGTVTYIHPTKNVIWIDDGTNLQAGGLTPGGDPIMGMAVLLPPGLVATPPVGSYLGVTGVMLAVPGGTVGDTYPVRMLVPRDAADIADLLAP